MSVVVLNDEIVHYEVLGRGRPLFFLHGWVGSWRYWIPCMQAAAISFRTYALDLWGFGDTAKKESLYPIEAQFQLLDLFMQEMGIGKVALIGHGLGALVASLFARQYPHLVDRIVLISYPSQNSMINPRLSNASPIELADWLLGKSPDSEAARMEASKADPQAIQRSVKEMQALNLDNLPSSLSTPCLMAYGINDPAIACPSPDLVSSLPEHIHQIFFEQSGHFPMLDEPNQFNRLIADFLALSSGVSPRQLQLKDEWKRRVR